MANSTEFEQDTPRPDIDVMPDPVGVEIGGTMRLGHWPCQIRPETLAEEVYGRAGPANATATATRSTTHTGCARRCRDGLLGHLPDGRLVEIAE